MAENYFFMNFKNKFFKIMTQVNQKLKRQLLFPEINQYIYNFNLSLQEVSIYSTKSNHLHPLMTL